MEKKQRCDFDGGTAWRRIRRVQRQDGNFDSDADTERNKGKGYGNADSRADSSRQQDGGLSGFVTGSRKL